MKKLLIALLLFLLANLNLVSAQTDTPAQPYSIIYNQEQNGRWGMMGRNGAQEDILIPFEYEYLSAFYYDWMVAKKNGKYGMINRKNQVVVPFQYDDMLDNVHQGYACFKKGKKWGVINRKGEITVPFEYDKIEKPALFDERPGRTAYEADWLETGSFRKNNFLVQKAGKYGVINGDGTVSLPVEYQEIRPTSSDCNLVLKKNGRYAIYICYAPGKCQFKYDTIALAKSNLFIVGAGGKMGLAGHEDQAVLPLEYEDVVHLERNYYAFKKAGKYGLYTLAPYDSKISTVLPQEYDAIGPASVRYASIKRNGKYGLFDYFNGKIALRPVFEKIEVTNSGQFVVKNSGLYGLHSASGKEIVLPVYDDLQAIPPKLAAVDKVYVVKRDKKSGLIDSLGQVLMPVQYDSITYLQFITDPRKQAAGCKGNTCFTGIYKAYLQGQIYLVDSDGKIYNDTGVDKITVQNAWIRTERNNKYGLLSITGSTVVLPEYAVIKIGNEAEPEIRSWRQSGKITNDSEPYIIARKNKTGMAELFDEAGKKVGEVN